MTAARSTRATRPTEVAIESLTDPGLFEALAIDVLRVKYPGTSFVSTGTNPAGKSIPAPVDAVGVENTLSGSRICLVQCSTEKRKTLAGKWLRGIPPARPAETATTLLSAAKESPREGDLLKAARDAKTWLAECPNAHIRIALVTNIAPPSGLPPRAHGAARRLGVELEILDNAALAHVLDNTPTGQAIREKHLGRPAELCSWSLAITIARRSLGAYVSQERFGQPTTSVETSAIRALQTALDDPTLRLIGLVGDSGFGKTTAAAHVMAVCDQRQNTLALWVPGRLVETSTSLVGLLDAALRSWYPTLGPNCGEELLDQAGGGRRVVLVVDDVMKIAAPIESGRRLVAWALPTNSLATSGTETADKAAMCLVLPCWSGRWNSIVDDAMISERRVHRIDCGRFTDADTATAIREACAVNGRSIAEHTLAEVVRRVAGDPFVIGMVGSAAANVPESQLPTVTDDLVAHYVGLVIASLSGRTGAPPAIVYQSAIRQLVAAMITARDLEPTWPSLRAWLGADSTDIQAIQDLVADGRLCMVTSDATEAFRFRHDRVRDALLASRIETLLGEPDTNWGVLIDPFLAPQVGAAVRRLDISVDLANRLRRSGPLVLAEALRAAGEMPFASRDRVLQALTGWAEDTLKPAADPCASATTMETLNVVFDILSAEVLPILQRCGTYPHVLWSRFGRGDWRAGLYAVRANVEEPAWLNQHRDGMVAFAIARDWDGLLTWLATTLDDVGTPANERRAALILAGLIGKPELTAAVTRGWRPAGADPMVIAAGIWAFARCTPLMPLTELEPLLEAWDVLSRKSDDPQVQSEHHQVTIGLRVAFEHTLSETAAQSFVTAAKVHPGLAMSIANALCDSNAPTAVEYLIRCTVNEFGDGDREMPHWLSAVIMRSYARVGMDRPSTPARQARLREMWSNADHPQAVRDYAFLFWLPGSALADLWRLPAPPSDAARGDVLKRRCQYGDVTALTDVLTQALVDYSWLGEAHLLWADELQRTLDDALRQRPQLDPGTRGKLDIVLADLVHRIPIIDAEAVLTAHWSTLKGSPIWTAAAFAVALPSTLRMFETAMRNGVHRPSVWHWVMRFLQPMAGDQSQLRREHLDALVPYIDELQSSDRGAVAYFCRQRGYATWARMHLAQHLESIVRVQIFPTDEDLDQWVDIVMTTRPERWYVRSQLDTWAKHPDLRPMVIQVGARVARRNGNPEDLALFAECLAHAGDRSHLHLLDPQLWETTDATTIARLDDARFAIMQRTTSGYGQTSSV